MAKKFADLRRKMPAKAQDEASARAQAMLAEMPLSELRRAKALSQVQLADLLEVDQAAVSKIEHRTDMYISTLRSYIEAMGGELEIVARFPEGRVRIKRFAEFA